MNNKIFITYSWDSPEHQTKVRAFVNHLRENGFDSEMDQSVSQNETAIDFDKMMHRIITDYPKVIVVLSNGYKKKAEKFIAGVGKEYSMIIKDIDSNPKKYILLTFESQFSDEIYPIFFKGRDTIQLSKNKNYEESMNSLYAKLGDIPMYDFSEVNPIKTLVKTKKIGSFDDYMTNIDDLNNAETIFSKPYSATISSTPSEFLELRIGKAFPGVRGLKEFKDSFMENLEILFKAPLYFDNAIDSGDSDTVFPDPIWWFRGDYNDPIKTFKRLDGNRCLINIDEFEVAKVIVYRSQYKGKSFIYLETKALPSTGSYDGNAQATCEPSISIDSYTSDPDFIHITNSANSFIKTEEYADLHGISITSTEAADVQSTAEIRIRHLADTNLIIGSKESPFDLREIVEEVENILDNILLGQVTVVDLIEIFEPLPIPKLGISRYYS